MAVDILYKNKLVFMRPKDLKKKFSFFHFNQVETKKILSNHYAVKIPKFDKAEIDCSYLKGTNLFLVKSHSGDSLIYRGIEALLFLNEEIVLGDYEY